MKHWADVHGIGYDEPILAINIRTCIEPFAAVDEHGDGSITREEYEAKTKKKDFDRINTDGNGLISVEDYLKATLEADPLSGQGIHRDGMQAVTVLCISRENYEGAESELYEDHAGTRHIDSITLQPGNSMYFVDTEIFHNVTCIKPIDATKLMQCSVLVLLAWFQDEWWHANMVEQYGKKGYKCIQGKGELEMLSDLLDTDSNGKVDSAEFFPAMCTIMGPVDLEKMFKNLMLMATEC